MSDEPTASIEQLTRDHGPGVARHHDFPHQGVLRYRPENSCSVSTDCDFSPFRGWSTKTTVGASPNHDLVLGRTNKAASNQGRTTAKRNLRAKEAPRKMQPRYTTPEMGRYGVIKAS